MTTYENCQIAISALRIESSANVDKDSKLVSCEREKSACNWVGYGLYHTCLDERNTKNVPENVYDTLSGGNQSKIVVYSTNV